MLKKPWGRFVQALLYSEVPTVAGLVSLMETLWWPSNGILRVLAHEVKTTSSGSIGRFPICLPTQFSHHKNGQASLELKHGQFPYKANFVPHQPSPSYQGRVEKGKTWSSEVNGCFLGIRLEVTHKTGLEGRQTQWAFVLHSQNLAKHMIGTFVFMRKLKNKQKFSQILELHSKMTGEFISHRDVGKECSTQR